jgi:hypothetical protein
LKGVAHVDSLYHYSFNYFRFQSENLDNVNATIGRNDRSDAKSDDVDDGDEYGYGKEPPDQFYRYQSVR